MPIYRPSELRQFLLDNGLSPKKILSQNFLIDGNILNKIIATAEVTPGDVVLEIGPGPGALTELLLNEQAHVIAVEKDRQLCDLLPRLMNLPGSLSLYNQDIMTFPIKEKIEEAIKKGKKAKVIANLPYHLTTPILEKLLPLNHLFSKIIVMVQDEVAHRLTSSPSCKEYGSFTVYVKYYSDPTYAFQVKRNCFHPAPKVHSAIVAMDLKSPPSDIVEDKFFEMTRTAFQMRRKMLRKSLSKLFPLEEVSACLESIGINPQCRPEDLSIDQFLDLYRQLYPSV
ncbi:MAG: 16S rRNA (adenine(1518)-N(6)/adenine(1519)-N(6))-dimethyltransferase RsmA [Chlamydiota bacterium]